MPTRSSGNCRICTWWQGSSNGLEDDRNGGSSRLSRVHPCAFTLVLWRPCEGSHSREVGHRACAFAVLVAPAPRTSLQAQAAAVVAPAGCSLTWVGQEAEIEAFLRTAKVTKLEHVPIGVTKPQRAVFEPGGLVRRAAWKPLAPSYR